VALGPGQGTLMPEPEPEEPMPQGGPCPLGCGRMVAQPLLGGHLALHARLRGSWATPEEFEDAVQDLRKRQRAEAGALPAPLWRQRLAELVGR
jgi:hypothetical protein